MCYDVELLGLGMGGLDPVVSKRLSGWIIFIQILIASDPDDTGPILEQSSDKHPAQTPGVRWVMEEDLEFVAVVAVQSVLSTEPHESLIVLHGLGHADLGESVTGRSTVKPDIRSRNYGWVGGWFLGNLRCGNGWACDSRISLRPQVRAFQRKQSWPQPATIRRAECRLGEDFGATWPASVYGQVSRDGCVGEDRNSCRR